MKKKHSSVMADLIKFSILPLLIFGVAVLLVTSYTISASMEKEVESGLGSLARSLHHTYSLLGDGDFVMENNILKKGSRVVSGDFSIVDDIKMNSSIDATIFYGDERVLTSIRNEDGSRAVGSRASQVAAHAVLLEGNSYFSKNIRVRNQAYYGYYLPLRNSNGVIVGMVFVGKPRQVVVKAIRSTVEKIVLIALVMLVGACAFSMLYAKKIIYVLQKTKEFLGSIARGDIQKTVDPCLLERTDEIGEMGRFSVILQKSITDLVGSDPLTGLYNRRSANIVLENRMKDCPGTSTPFTLAMGDIDWFKKINDTYGHLCGDMVLKELACLFQSHMEDKGFVFRWGGEEFLLLYEKSDIAEAVLYLDQLQTAIRNMNLSYNGQKIQLTMTFGVAEYDGQMDLETLIKLADKRLYFGKTKSKDQVIF